MIQFYEKYPEFYLSFFKTKSCEINESHMLTFGNEAAMRNVGYLHVARRMFKALEVEPY